MTQARVTKIIADYEALLSEALEIAAALGCEPDATYDDGVTLRIEGNTAVIGYPTNDSYDPGMGWEDTIPFPAEMLFADAGERAKLIGEFIAARERDAAFTVGHSLTKAEHWAIFDALQAINADIMGDDAVIAEMIARSSTPEE